MGKAWQAHLGLATLNKFSGLWGTGAVLNGLVPGGSGSECESPIKKVIVGMSSG